MNKFITILKGAGVALASGAVTGAGAALSGGNFSPVAIGGAAAAGSALGLAAWIKAAPGSNKGFKAAIAGVAGAALTGVAQATASGNFDPQTVGGAALAGAAVTIVGYLNQSPRQPQLPAPQEQPAAK